MIWRQRGVVLMSGVVVAAALFAGARWRSGPGIVMPGENPDALVEFSATERPSADASLRTWEARFVGRSGTAHFDIVVEVRAAPAAEAFSSTRGSFRARDDSRPGDLLRALARAHHGSRRAKATGRVRAVSFEAALLGLALSRRRGPDVVAGEFTSNPPGPWIVAKIFLPPEDAEIFVALNTSAGVGLFVPKDDEYWPDLEPVLASVL